MKSGGSFTRGRHVGERAQREQRHFVGMRTHDVGQHLGRLVAVMQLGSEDLEVS